MELIKPLDLEIGQKVESWSDVKQKAKDLLEYLDKNNFHFLGNHEACYALHHCQVDKQPLNFFVVAKNIYKGEKDALPLFESRIIINPEILEAPEKIEKTFPNKKEVKKDGKVVIEMSMVKSEVSNVIDAKEGCMSFPERTLKSMPRYFQIKVRYQYPWPEKLPVMLKTKEEVIDGLKAHIFQHETDHARGFNIYHGNKKKNK